MTGQIGQDDIDNKNQNNQGGHEKIITPGQIVMKKFMRNKLAIAGIVILVIMAVFCYVGPFFSPYGEYEIFYKVSGQQEVEEYRNSDPNIPQNITINSKEPPSSRHWLGTNRDGQDVFTRLMYGGRVSLMIGYVCVGIELLLGILLGGIAGYYGRWVDAIIMRIVDIFYCLPTIPMVLILTSLLLQYNVPNEYKIYILMLLIGLLGWAGAARMIRGQILSLREQEYMIAAEAVGLKARDRIFKHLIPNVVPQIIVMATLGIGGVILLESALSYLGLGVSMPNASWGNMVGAVKDTQIMIKQPFIWVPPGVCILLTVLAFNFVGDGLRDAFDPKMKR